MTCYKFLCETCQSGQARDEVRGEDVERVVDGGEAQQDVPRAHVQQRRRRGRHRQRRRRVVRVRAGTHAHQA